MALELTSPTTITQAEMLLVKTTPCSSINMIVTMINWWCMPLLTMISTILYLVDMLVIFGLKQNIELKDNSFIFTPSMWIHSAALCAGLLFGTPVFRKSRNSRLWWEINNHQYKLSLVIFQQLIIILLQQCRAYS